MPESTHKEDWHGDKFENPDENVGAEFTPTADQEASHEIPNEVEADVEPEENLKASSDKRDNHKLPHHG